MPTAGAAVFTSPLAAPRLVSGAVCIADFQVEKRNAIIRGCGDDHRLGIAEKHVLDGFQQHYPLLVVLGTFLAPVSMACGQRSELTGEHIIRSCRLCTFSEQLCSKLKNYLFVYRAIQRLANMGTRRMFFGHNRFC